MRFMELRGEWDPKAKRKLPPTLGPALVRSGKAVGCLAIYFAMKTYFPTELLESDKFFSSSIFYRSAAQRHAGPSQTTAPLEL